MSEWIKAKVQVYNASMEELTGKRENAWLPCSIKKSGVLAYKSASDDSGDDENGQDNCTSVYFDGDYFIVNIKYADFEKMMDE